MSELEQGTHWEWLSLESKLGWGPKMSGTGLICSFPVASPPPGRLVNVLPSQICLVKGKQGGQRGTPRKRKGGGSVEVTPALPGRRSPSQASSLLPFLSPSFPLPLCLPPLSLSPPPQALSLLPLAPSLIQPRCQRSGIGWRASEPADTAPLLVNGTRQLAFLQR